MTNEHAFTNSPAAAPQEGAPAVLSAQVVLPIVHTSDAKILPRRYLIHKHSQHCKNCGTLHEWSQTYAFNEMMTRTGAGKLVVHLIPISELRFNLPIQVVSIARREIPVCHECAATASLSHLVDPRGSPEWRTIYAVAQAPQEAAKSHPAKPRALPKTINDLLF